ncbi:hypothetical protein [Plantactinospora sp. B24E8]|uniref:hypothetical protein n=1 Tax=Plantactinospora sp. B24E8 TaxID=3153567 RepID=UPI00325DDA6C
MRAHRRNWRRLWRYCWCGFRWACPDAVPVVPMPFDPDPGARPRTLNQSPAWHGPAGSDRRNQRPSWPGPTGYGHRVGRVGRLTPAQRSRTSDRPN